jgi:hypothetical protein
MIAILDCCIVPSVSSVSADASAAAVLACPAPLAF